MENTSGTVGRIATAALVATVCAVVGGLLLGQTSTNGSATGAAPAARAAGGGLANGPGGPDAGSKDASGQRASRSFDRSTASTTDPGSIWVIVNKTHPITASDFRPEISLVRGYQVATAAAPSLERLLVAGDRLGLGLKIASAFRSYEYQVGVHENLVATRGTAAADAVSARAGYSEHQTGLAVDLVTPADPACDFEACFGDAPGGQWLAGSAWRYGFIIRYPPGSVDVTGYSPEPWHLRYVGRELAAELRDAHVATLEEFFEVPGGNYPDP